MNSNTRTQISAASHLGWLVPLPFLGTGLIYFFCQDAEVREHARQAIFYQLMMLIVSMFIFSGSIFMAMLLPNFLLRLFSAAISLLCLGFLIPPLMGAYRAFQGERYRYPVIGGLARLLPLP